MKILACINLLFLVLGLLIFPLLIGEEREPYSYADYIARWCTVGLLLPIIGRILGWW